jgi:PAS domain S-box-containing protein
MSDAGPSDSDHAVALTSRIETAAALLAAIVASSSDAILSKTLDGRITSWNAATEELFGYRAVEIIGQSIRLLIPAERQAEEDAILERIAAGERVENYETVRLHKDGRRLDVLVTISPVRDANGVIVGASKIIRDISERKRAEESAALLSAIVASSFDGIVSKSLDGTVTSWNRAAEQLFGYSAQDMIGQPIRRLIPADRQFEEDDILRRIARGETVACFETVRLHRSGRPIEVSVTVSPVRDVQGTVIGASKIVRDISDRRRAEEQIRTLVAEVHHRTKNLLGLVQAIARQTAAAPAEDFLESFSARLKALAANQDLLVRNDFGGIDMADLVAAQLAPFADVAAARIEANGPPVRLTPTAAQQIGMALHELMTNAAKYGALSSAAGRAVIDWQCEEEVFAMNWTEYDGPDGRRPARTGFGTRLLTTLVPASMGGTGVLEFAPGGPSWRFRSPVRNVLAQTL